MTKICDSLHRECGEKPHSSKIDDKSSLAENYLTEDSIYFKKASDSVADKFEIIGLNLIRLSKFRNEIHERVDKIEKFLPKCFTMDQFRE